MNITGIHERQIASLEAVVSVEDALTVFQCPEVQLRQRQGRGEQPAQARSVSEASESLPWMLDRLDQASLPLDNTYSYNSNGTGVDG